MSLYDVHMLDFDLQRLESEAFNIPKIVSDREHVSNCNGGIQIHDWQWDGKLNGTYIEEVFWPALKYFLDSIDGNIWLNVNPPGSYNKSHIHQGDRSGVYYVKVPEGSGDLVFTETMESVTPKPGMLITFDAATAHAVEPNLSDEPRISFAFNYEKNEKKFI